MWTAEEIDLKNPQLMVDFVAPRVGERIGQVVGDVQRAIDAVKSASSLLQSGDGIAISTSMAAAIQLFTGWLRGKLEADNVEERENIYKAQQVFIGPPSPRWIWRQPVGGPPASKVVLKKSISWTGAKLLKQYNPGAVYIFPRLGWDVIRRSFRRTDAPNVFDDGQPTLKWSPVDIEVASCPSRYADYYGGEGCGYNPGEKIQLSPGTWPYMSGADVVQWSGVTAVDGSGHYLAIHTPSAIHVQIDVPRVVMPTWLRWRSLVVDKLPLLPGQGQADPGIYRTAERRVYVQGDPRTQYAPITINNVTYQASGEAVRYVTDTFLDFFALREAVLRDWEFLAPSVREAGKSSADPAVKARAMGGPYQGPKDAGKPAPSGGGDGGGGGAVAAAAGLGLAWWLLR